VCSSETAPALFCLVFCWENKNFDELKRFASEAAAPTSRQASKLLSANASREVCLELLKKKLNKQNCCDAD